MLIEQGGGLFGRACEGGKGGGEEGAGGEVAGGEGGGELGAEGHGYRADEVDGVPLGVGQKVALYEQGGSSFNDACNVGMADVFACKRRERGQKAVGCGISGGVVTIHAAYYFVGIETEPLCEFFSQFGREKPFDEIGGKLLPYPCSGEFIAKDVASGRGVHNNGVAIVEA